MNEVTYEYVQHVLSKIDWACAQWHQINNYLYEAKKGEITLEKVEEGLHKANHLLQESIMIKTCVYHVYPTIYLKEEQITYILHNMDVIIRSLEKLHDDLSDLKELMLNTR